MDADLDRLIHLQTARLAPPTPRAGGSPRSPSARRRSTTGSRPPARPSPRRKKRLARIADGPPRDREGGRRPPGPPLEVPRAGDVGEDQRGIPRDPEGDRLRAGRDQDARGQDPRADARGRRDDRRSQTRRSGARAGAEGGRRGPPRARRRGGRPARVGRAPRRRARRHRRRARARRCSPSSSRSPRNATAWRSPKPGPASARSATCGCVRRSSTPSCRNESIVQCDSCQRILYFVADARRRRPPTASASPPSDRSRLRSIVAYIDGGARGNPGPAGYGVRDRARRRHAGRGVRRSHRRRHQQRRRIPRPHRGARVGEGARPRARCTCDPTRSCSCSRCAGCSR